MTERLSPDQLAARRDAVGALGSALRDLVDAAVRTEVPLAELEDVTATVQQLAARLRVDMRGLQETTPLDDPETGDRWYSPAHGAGNPLAPRLTATDTPDGRATGRVTLGKPYEGPPGVVHGGVVASLFDHILARAVRAAGRGGMTAELSVTYRRPVRLGVPMLLTAKLGDADGRRTTALARIVAEDDPGTTLAEAEGMFVSLRPDVPLDLFPRAGAGDA